MKLLFLALSQRGFGETVVGMSLARQLRPLGVRSHFVVEAAAEQVICHGGFAYSVIRESMGPLAGLVIDDIVAAVKPDALVLSDYVIYIRTMRGTFGLDPWFIDRYSLPILPIDIWELDGRDLAIDLGGRTGPPIHPRIRELAGHLQPVPFAHPRTGGAGRGFPFRLSTDGGISRRTRGHLFNTFGIPRGHRLALIPIAGWQQSPEARYDERFHRIARQVPLLLARYLRSLPPTTHFLVVGDAPEPLRSLPADRTIVLPSCSPRRFEVLVGAADLVISLNATSTTVGQAVMADIPAMVLSNRFAISDADMLDGPVTGPGSAKASEFVRSWLADTVPIYPFRVWPLGYHSFLEPVLAGNPYADALATAELLDEHGAVTMLEAALYDKATRESYARARAEFHRTVAALPDTCETFTRAAQAAGLTMR